MLQLAMKKIHKIALLVVLAIVTIFPRVLNLDAFRSPDEKRWIANTNGFVTKLATGRWKELVQQPHPGITTQWLGALTIRYESWEIKKLPITLAQALLILALGYIYGRAFNKATGIWVVLILNFNPFLYAHTRVYAMDSLLALLSILSIGLLLLWRKTDAIRYIVAAGAAAAAAVLSKFSGLLIIPFSAAIVVLFSWAKDAKRVKYCASNASLWLAGLIVGGVLLLPTLAIAPLSVWGDFMELFRSNDYQAMHQAGKLYYFATMLFFTTPAQWLLPLLIAYYWWTFFKHKKHSDAIAGVSCLLVFGVLFFIQMTMGLKKGERYILPSFVAMDAALAIMVGWLSSYICAARHHVTGKVLMAAVVAVVVWQAGIIYDLGPHVMAYVNPLTGRWFGEHSYGWGEGLDLAAQYLNRKPGASHLKAASYYPNEFAAKFVGQTVPAHQHEEEDVNYVVIYRAMFQRGPGAWETDVVDHWRSQKPENVISFNGIDFAWIYKK